MLFNSFIYLFLFLPITALGFFSLCRLFRAETRWPANLWLVAASLVFYSYWVPQYLPLILSSILVNYLAHMLMARAKGPGLRKLFLVLGVCFNVGLLGYFKYADFFIANVALVLGIKEPHLLNLALPLGISFFTFQQIAFLVDSHKGLATEYRFLNYSLFVSFFPQLIAGPIVHHKEMMPQFARPENARVNWDNVYVGLFFLALGLFKKLAVADTFGAWANAGFADAADLGFWRAWGASFSYTLQIYFDFSGYTDMALGSARLFNIRLPLNFNSPYLALDIQDFWRRWHMTLSRFLRDYIYIPLGGNRKGLPRTLINLFLTFFIGGVWHGAGWTFVLWGALHGGAMVLYRLWKRAGLRMPKAVAWIVTLLFVNAVWVYFRAPDIATANSVVLAMTNVSGHALSQAWSFLSGGVAHLGLWLPLLLVFILQDLKLRNSQEWAERCIPAWRYTLASAALFSTGVALLMNQNRFSEFLYFQF